MGVMKQLIVLLSGVCLLSMPAVSQTGVNPKYTLSLFQFEDERNAHPDVLHFTHSVGLDVPVEEYRFLVLPGIFYRRLSIVGDSGTPFTHRDNIHYFHLPMRLGYKFVRHRNFKLRAYAGGSVDFLVAVDGNPLELTTDRVSGVVYGILAGAQVELSPVTFDIGWQRGLRKVILSRPESSVRGLQLSIGIML